MLRHVDLCSGIGGFAYAFETVGLSKPVLFCDIEPWSRQILAKHWPDVPIAKDVKELANDPTRIIHAIGDRRSILSCGYPCQPFSQAGQRRGSQDGRHIWPEIFSIIQQIRPDWIVCENVSGHITMGLDEVLSDLADKANYAVQTFHLGALAVDAPHRRMRLWIVARNVGNSKHYGQFTKPIIRSGYETSDKWGQKKQTPTRESQGTDRPSDAASIRRSQSQSEQSGLQEEDRARNVADTASTRLQGAEWSEHKGNRDGLTTSSEDVADTDIFNRGGIEKSRKPKRQTWGQSPGNSSSYVADTDSQRLQGGSQTGNACSDRAQRNEQPARRNKCTNGQNWESESKLGGMVDGIPHWLDEPGDIPRVSTGVPNRVQRLKGLGNAIVPQIAMRIGQTIKAVEDA